MRFSQRSAQLRKNGTYFRDVSIMGYLSWEYEAELFVELVNLRSRWRDSITIVTLWDITWNNWNPDLHVSRACRGCNWDIVWNFSFTCEGGSKYLNVVSIFSSHSRFIYQWPNLNYCLHILRLPSALPHRLVPKSWWTIHLSELPSDMRWLAEGDEFLALSIWEMVDKLNGIWICFPRYLSIDIICRLFQEFKVIHDLCPCPLLPWTIPISASGFRVFEPKFLYIFIGINSCHKKLKNKVYQRRGLKNR